MGCRTRFSLCWLLKKTCILPEKRWEMDTRWKFPEKGGKWVKLAHFQGDIQDSISSCRFIEFLSAGGFGIDFSQDESHLEQGISTVRKGILANGVTAFCPTLITSPKEFYHRALGKIKKTAGGPEGAEILGAHVEGPFINVEKKGAHDTKYIQTFTNGFETFKEVYGSDWKNIEIITLAPELDNSCDVISSLKGNGITVSIGHSMGSLVQGETAVQCGATLITHLFNAMLPFHHRDPSLIGLLTSNKIPRDQNIFYGIIADGIHTHPAALRIAYRTHPKGIVLVTDAMSGLGLKPGTYQLGEQDVDVTEKCAVLAGTSTLCGSVATMDKCVKHFRTATGCSIVEALEAASLHPAQALGIQHKKGTLSFGADADFVFLDQDLNVQSTWIASQMVYEHPSASKVLYKYLEKS
nr:EOG090X06GX [Eulimnadia texana]